MEKEITFKLSAEDKQAFDYVYDVLNKIHSLYYDLVVDDELIENYKVEDAMNLIGLLEIADEIKYK